MKRTALGQFSHVLKKHGVLGQHGFTIVKGISGEDCLLAEWRSFAKRFIYKGQRISVGMHVERMHFNESRCYPVISASCLG